MSKNNPERQGHSRLRRSAPLVVSAIALSVAAGGVGVGASALITGSEIKNGSITGADIKTGSISGDDIKSGAIQVSDLSKGALTGLDGKDGKDGKDGAPGAAGPAGPAGARGASSAAGGGMPPIIDANGREVPNVIQGSATYEFSTNSFSVANFWIRLDGKNWRVLRDGQLELPYNDQRNQIIWFNDTCSGQAYLLNPPTGDALLGDVFRTPHDGTDHPAYWAADSTTLTRWTTGSPRSGFDDDGLCRFNTGWGDYTPSAPTAPAVPVSRRGPLAAPTVLDGPFRFEPTTN